MYNNSQAAVQPKSNKPKMLPIFDTHASICLCMCERLHDLFIYKITKFKHFSFVVSILSSVGLCAVRFYMDES